jgi:hypothetical protein
MIDGQFDVVFRGQVIKNMDLSLVKQNLVNLFRSSPEAVEKLFSGEEVVVRKSLDYATAMKYQSALKKAGALALIKEIESNKPESQTPILAKPTTSQGKAVFGAADAQPGPATKANFADGSSNEGAKKAETLEQSGREESETDSIRVEEPEDGSLSLAAAGAQILPDKVYEKRNVDTSDLSLAAVGERILPKSAPEEHPQPNIDYLKLE